MESLTDHLSQAYFFSALPQHRAQQIQQLDRQHVASPEAACLQAGEARVQSCNLAHAGHSRCHHMHAPRSAPPPSLSLLRPSLCRPLKAWGVYVTNSMHQAK